MSDTIYALASARGQAGVAVIRVSGEHAHDSFKRLTRVVGGIPYRSAMLRELKHPVSRETLDNALVIAFKSPHSYTGEDVIEYHLHGGTAVIRGVLDSLNQQDNHRMAEPGEFTRRAFENGKMDLTEAEAIADLIHAETQLQKDQALSQMGGALANIYDGWSAALTKILAYVEAEIEFPDEDLPDSILAKITPQITEMIAAFNDHLNDNRRGERLRDGINVAIIGAPNAGKSSLVNALTQRDIAIVSEIAGTTRDVIEAHLDIGGYPVILSDTAGLRPDQMSGNAQDIVESEGIKRALKIAKSADIRIILYDGTSAELDKYSYELEAQDNTIAVINKADKEIKLNHPAHPLQISVSNNQGISEFLSALTTEIETLVGKAETPALTRERHRYALNDCKDSLERCISAPLPELTAEDLRLAVRHLGRITGSVDVEDLLDVIFRDFCIGK